jgi:hypothetical protein
MLASLAVVQPAPPAPEVHAPPRAPAAHPFAELLRQNQAAPAAAQPATPALENHPSSNDTTPADAPAEARPAQAPRDRKTGERTPLMRRAAGASAAPPETPAGDRPGTSAPSATAAENHPAEGGLPAWLAPEGQPLPLDARMPDAVATDPAADAADATSRGRAPASGRAGSPAGAADDDPKTRAVGDRTVEERFHLEAAADARATEPVVPAHRFTEARALPATFGDGGAAAALPSGLTPTPAGTGAAPVQVGIPTAPGAPDFAATFGLQVSVLARDGVHKAELHLNPREMGPVSVQIVVDGTQARIDFGADVPATRQAIEAGIPELASALREAGLTLHGGGVSPHAGGREERGGGESGREPARTASTDEPLAAAHRPRTLHGVPGGVDLYA